MQNSHQFILSDRNGHKNYARKKLLGTGGFAKCYEVENLDDHQIYAAKVIPKKNIHERRQRYKLILQIKLHRSLPHENIVGFKEVFQDSENVYIILEYCKNSTLKDLVKRRRRLTEYETKVYTLQIVKALIYIHEHNIIHRDLKLGNILINENMQLKLCDFGLSARLKEKGQKKRTVCGTPNYIAPEILQQLGHSYEADIWSLGVIIYTMLTGKPPYQQNSVESTYLNIRNNKYSFPDIGLSEASRDLVQKILLLDPHKRLTLHEILMHEFMIPIENIPSTLPRYTLAIPPQHIDDKKIALKNLSVEYVYSEQLGSQALVVDKSIIIKQNPQQESQSIQQLQFSGKRKIDRKKGKWNIIYVRQAFLSDGDLGFLLSNGKMGIYYTKDRSSIILQYDQKYFVYAQRTEQDKISTQKYNIGILDEKVNSKYQKFISFVEFFKMKYYNDTFDQMYKRYKGQESDLIMIQKLIILEHEILLRLSNGVVQMHFRDSTSLFMNRNDDTELYYVQKNGQQLTFQYQHIDSIKSKPTKKKIKKFSNVLAKIWNKAQEIQQE